MECSCFGILFGDELLLDGREVDRNRGVTLFASGRKYRSLASYNNNNNVHKNKGQIQIWLSEAFSLRNQCCNSTASWPRKFLTNTREHYKRVSSTYPWIWPWNLPTVWCLSIFQGSLNIPFYQKDSSCPTHKLGHLAVVSAQSFSHQLDT